MGSPPPELPPVVSRYLERALPGGRSGTTRVRLEQRGEVRLRPDGRWLPFSAVQETWTVETAFAWRARVRMLPLVSVHVSDRLRAGVGAGEVRLLGVVPMGRESGPDVATGAVLRYLAELPWAPHALYANTQLEWREVDPQTVEVAAPPAARLRLRLDAQGDVVEAHADARPRKEGGVYVPRAWGGSFGEHAVVGGARIPTEAEVTWQLPDGPFTWFRATITSLEPLTDP